MNNLNILFAVNKPKDISSFDVIRFIKKKLHLGRKIKIGHLGTLDPFANGILLIAIGNTCKLMGLGSLLSKTYTACGRLGEQTDTGDLTGKVIKTCKILENWDFSIFDKLIGEYYQTPPFYSAVKHNGVPLYKLARDGIYITKDPVLRHIYSLKILKYDKDSQKLSFVTETSSGTYIRTLFEDMTSLINMCGNLKDLTRNKIGNIDLSKSIQMQDVSTENILKHSIELDCLFNFSVIDFSDDDKESFLMGKKIEFKNNNINNGLYWLKNKKIFACVELREKEIIKRITLCKQN